MAKVESNCAILEVLSDATEPMRPSDIGEIVGLSALVCGNLLRHMQESGLVNKPDKKKPFYEITDKGRQYLANPPEEPEEEVPKETTQVDCRSRLQKRTTVDTAQDITEETTGTVSSQADLFRSIGGKLGVGAKKGDVRLDATMSESNTSSNIC